jgi:hypothetical protein
MSRGVGSFVFDPIQHGLRAEEMEKADEIGHFWWLDLVLIFWFHIYLMYGCLLQMKQIRQ